MKLGEITIGPERCRVSAELAQCPGDSVEEFVKAAEAARGAGCDFVKGQILNPAQIAAKDSPPYWATDHSSQFEAFGEFGILDRGRWGEVLQECRRIGIGFGATPFDLEAVDILEQIGADFIKVASGDITHQRLIKKASTTGIPIVVSTGAASLTEVREAVKWVKGRVPVILLACTLSYPTPPNEANLGRIETLRAAFPYHFIGYSDHTEETDTSFPAAAMGAAMCEKHFTLHRDVAADDGKMAMTPEQMFEYVTNAKKGSVYRGAKSLGCREVEKAAKKGARRSLRAARAIRKGHVIRPDDVIALRPEDGLSAARVDHVVGREAGGDYEEGDVLVDEWDV